MTLKQFVFALGIWVLPFLSFGQMSAPDVQVPQRSYLGVDRLELGELIADSSVRALDVYSTHIAISQGNREVFLPRFVYNGTASLSAYSAGTVVLDWSVARILEKRGHRRIAHWVTAVDLGQDAVFSIHNLFLPSRPSATQSPLSGAPIPIPRPDITVARSH